MKIGSFWVPKSRRGREVVRVLKEAGYPATYENTMGRYVCNLSFARDLDVDTRIKIAYTIAPESADGMIRDAWGRARDVCENWRAYGLAAEPDLLKEYGRACEEIF